MTSSTKRSDGPGGSTSRAGASLGARVTHDTAVYTSGSFIGFTLALLNIAVVTRFLPPGEFGQLALLLVFAGFLTVFFNLGMLQGTFIWVFGAAEEEEVEDDVGGGSARDKRRSLGTGLVVTALICAAGTGIIFLLSAELAQVLLGDPSRGGLVRLAAIAGAGGAIWRLTSNVLRLERKPYRFVALSTARPILVTGAVILLVASGGGVEGAIAGTAIGGWIAIAVSLVVIHGSLRPALDRADVRMIARRGALFVPIVVSFWIAQNVDLFMLSRFAPDDQVGLYRLAGRVGAFVSYFSSALFMAWTPLRRTPAFAALTGLRGKDVVGGVLLTYFVLGGMLLLLGMTATADALVRIAPPAYEQAAPLIPLLAGGFLAHGLLVAVYRVSSFPAKRLWYVGSALTSAVAFLLLAGVLIPWLGATGAALTVILAFLLAVLVMALLSQRSRSPLRIEYGRIAAGLALAGVCMGVARGLGPTAGSWQPLVELIALLAYPMMLAATGVIPRREREGIWEALRQAVAPRRRGPRIEQNLATLTPEDFAGLELVAARGRKLGDLASTSAGGPDAGERLVGALRQLAGLQEKTDHDARIAEYLFSDLPVAERDAIGRELWMGEVDATELHALEETLERLRRLPTRTWLAASRERDRGPGGLDGG